ncbi:MAG TPA: hypothetical protein VMM92_00530, partial [Thermoanaerobaculia bacterium]|nr:hypothetical protein [Thermoanaerobaculia bacterium]
MAVNPLQSSEIPGSPRALALAREPGAEIPARWGDSPGSPLSAVELWASRLYALHLLTVFGIALSNIFLGLTLLVSPFALRGRSALRGLPAVPWAKLRPIYLPLGLYVLLLTASIVASAEP